LPEGWDKDLFPPGTIRPHDIIEINGTRYELLSDPHNTNSNVRFTDSTTNVDTETDTGLNFYKDPNPTSGNNAVTIMAQPVNNSGQQINPRYDNAGYSLGPDREPSPPAPAKPLPPYWTLPAPYKVLRQPTPASDEPYQLPEGAAIDLRASGVGNGDYFYWPGMNDNSENIVIMFAPEGRVSRVTYSQLPLNSQTEPDMFDKPVVDNVYLLVGRRENIPAPDATNATADPTLNLAEWTKATTDEARDKLRKPINWLNGAAMWITIGSQTGRVVTEKNAFVDLAGVLADPSSPLQSTEDMRAAQTIATREFTREMSQVGGR
jgi:hypothetical protein